MARPGISVSFASTPRDAVPAAHSKPGREKEIQMISIHNTKKHGFYDLAMDSKLYADTFLLS